MTNRPTPFDSDALRERSLRYPVRFGGRVPLTIRVKRTVRSELPEFVTGGSVVARGGGEYDALVNSYGAVTAILRDGQMLGLKPDEYEVVAWHEADAVQTPHDKPEPRT